MLFKSDNPILSIFLCIIHVFHTAYGYVRETGLVSQENATRYYFNETKGVALDTASAYTFFGQDFHRFYINGHGMIGLGQDMVCCFANYHAQSPRILTVAAYMRQNQQSDDPLYAKVFYEELNVEQSTSELMKVNDDIKWSFPNYEGSVNKMIVATWRNIPVYGSQSYRDFRNTFQTVIAKDHNNTFVVFYYNIIEWPSTYTYRDPAEAGIYGRQSHPSERYLLPGSNTYSLVYISGMSNIDRPGKFVFKVDSGIQFPTMERKCAPVAKLPQFIDVRPRLVPVAGVTPVVLSGVSICSDYNITSINCAYIEETSGFNMTTTGIAIPGNMAIVCQTPETFSTLGKHRMKIQVEFSHNKTVETEAYIFVTEITYALSNTFNTGSFYLPKRAANMYPYELAYITTNLLGRHARDSIPRLVTVSVLVFTQNQWKEAYRMGTSDSQTTFHLPPDIREAYFQESTDIIARLRETFHIRLNNYKTITVENVYDIEPKSFARRSKYVCSHHFSNETIKKYTIDGNLQCPVTFDHANLDFNFHKIRLAKFDGLPISTFIHITGGETTSMVCVYNKTTKLLQVSTEINYTGTAKNPNIKFALWEDFLEEYVRYLECCSLGNFTCVQLSKNQPAMNNYYSIPRTFQVIGSSQITNTDGTTVALTGGDGVFWLFRSKHLAVQIFTQWLEPQSEHSATVVKQVRIFSNDDMFQVSVGYDGLQVRMNNLPVNFFESDGVRDIMYFYQQFTIYGDNFTAKITGPENALFTFHHGVYLDFVPCVQALAIYTFGYIEVEKLDNISGILSELHIGMSRNFSILVNEWRVSNEDIFFPIGKALFNDSWNNNHKDIQVKRPDELVSSARNVAFCHGTISCKIDIILSGNNGLARCSLHFSTKFEKIQRVAQYNVSNFAGTQEMKITPLSNNQERPEETSSSESDDYSPEIYSHSLKSLETTQKPTFLSEYITNTKRTVYSEDQDSTTKTYTALTQPLPSRDKVQERQEETNRADNDHQTDYNSLEVYSHSFKFLETTQKPTFLSEYVTNTKEVNYGDQDSTTKTYTTISQLDIEIFPYFDMKLVLIIFGVLTVLCILAFAGTLCLYIGVRRNARPQSEVALNWVVQYKP